MTKLDKPVTIGAYTLRGVDDWLCFCTDAAGNWYQFQTECSPMWPELPKCFVGKIGYPDTDEGVFATAVLEARAGYRPKPIDPEYVDELIEHFGEPADAARARARRIIANCERDRERLLSPGECRDLLMDNTEWRSDQVAAIVRELGR